MPCMCYYTPSEENEKTFKRLVKNVVDFVKDLEKEGDPQDCTLKDAHILMDHLYDPRKCKEKNEFKF